MRVLVAYDGSACAEAALDNLGRAGLPADARVKVLSVFESWLPPPYGLDIVDHVDLEKECLAMSRRGAERLAVMAPGWEVKAGWDAGSPATSIIDNADGWGADLVVVGSHGRTAVGQLLFGSVSQKTLHEARCSVRVSRGRRVEPGLPVRLIIGIDGSVGAAAAVEAVAARDWPADSEARIVNATWALPPSSPPHAGGTFIEWVVGEKTRIKKAIDELIGKLEAAGLKADALVKEEEPKRLLISEAEDWGADCIFVGARGLGGVGRFLLGSVSSSVAARAPCSVEVTRG
jgi:nucleotide-binding universal stress UspA family protein